MKYYLLLFVFIASCAAVISDSFELIDLSAKSDEIATRLTENLTAKAVIEGGIVLKILPTPHIEVINFKLFDDDKVIFRANKIVLDVSVIDLINGIKNIEKINARINEASVGISDFRQYIELRKQNKQINVQINKADIEIDKEGILPYSFFVKNLVFSVGQNLDVQGDFNINRRNILFKYQEAGDNNISFNLSNDWFEFKVILDNFDGENFLIKSGKVNFKIKKITSIFLWFLDSYDDDQHTDSNNKALEYKLEVSGDLGVDLNNEISVTNITSTSNFIDDLDIEIRLYKVMNNIFESYVRIHADKINLSYVKDIVTEKITINNIFDKILSTSQISQYINLNLNFDVNKLIFNDGQISNISCNTYHILNRVVVNKFDALLPGESQIHATGLISGNNFRKKIDGVIKIDSKNSIDLLSWYNENKIIDSHNHKNLTITSRIFSIKNLLKASDYVFKRDDSYIRGSAYFYEIPYEEPATLVSLEGEQINFDEIGFTSEWDGYIKKLYDADGDRSNEEYFKLTNANSWIRSFSKNLYLDLNLKNSTIRDKIIKKVKGLIKISRSNFDIKTLKIKNDKIDGDMKLRFILPVLRPQISANFNFSKLDFKYAKDLILPDISDQSKEKINFFSANNYDGTLKFKIDDLIIDDELNPKFINGEVGLKFGYITIPKLQYSLWNGQFDSTGSITISSNKPTFDCDFSIYNIDPKGMFYTFTGVDKINGYMSLAGNIQGEINKLDKINGSVDFLGAQIVWDGFNLDKVVEIVDGNYTKVSKIEGAEYYSSYGSTTFDILKGKMLIRNGVVSIDNAEISDKRLAGLFSVNYDLGSRILKSASSFAFIPSGFTDKLTINFQTSGSIANPTENAVDYTSISNFIENSSQR